MAKLFKSLSNWRDQGFVITSKLTKVERLPTINELLEKFIAERNNPAQGLHIQPRKQHNKRRGKCN